MLNARVVKVALLLSLGLLAPAALFPAPAGEAPTALVVAVDTSRSLSPQDLRVAVGRLRLALEGLPADTSTGLIGFDDEPRWIRQPGASPSEVGAALADLVPSGQYTLLNDALFVATQALADGGVILLMTDGRDENSATTVGDIARRCEDRGIRVVSVGIGSGIQERALRRLALVSNGTYLGEWGRLEAAAIARAVVEALQETAEVPATGPATTPSLESEGPASDGTPATETETTGPSSAAAPTRALAGRRTLLAYLPWLALAAVAVIGLVLWRRQRSSSRGVDSPDGGLSYVLQLELAQREPASLQETPEASSLEERLEKTQILIDQSVLIVRRSGQEPRQYLLGREKCFAVGRVPKGNTLAIPDPALSARHFRIVPEEGKYYFLDVGSTNGSLINGRRINAKELQSGDIIRAGQVEFEFQRYG